MRCLINKHTTVRITADVTNVKGTKTGMLSVSVSIL